MEKWLLGFFAQSLGVSPQTSHFRVTRMPLQSDGNKTPVSKCSARKSTPLPDRRRVPWAPYFVGDVPAWANVPFKADGLFPQSKEPFSHFLQMGLLKACVILPGAGVQKRLPGPQCRVSLCSCQC